MKKLILSFSMLFIYTILIHSQWSPNWNPTNSLSGSSADAGVKLVYKGSYIYVVGHVYDGSSLTVPYALRTLKYNTSGSLQWAATYPSFTPIQANGIDVDDNGNVYIVGTKDNGTDDDFITIKYNSTDGSQVWATQYNGNGQDEAGDIAVGVFGGTTYAFVTGASFNSSVEDGTMDIYTICYYANSTNGGQYWANRFTSCAFGDNGDDKAFTIAIKNSTNGPSYRNGVYVGGWYDNGNNCEGGGNYSCLHDAQIVHYNYDGTTLATDHEEHYGCGPDNGEDWIADLVVSPETGKVYGVGAKWCQAPGFTYHSHEMFVFECNWEYNVECEYAACTEEDYEFCYDAEFCDASRYHNLDGGENIGLSIAIDGNDNTYVTGYSDGNGTGVDIITYRCDASGDIVWSNRYNSSGSNPDIGRSIGFNSSYVFVTGLSGYGGSNADIKTLQYDISTGDISCIATYNGGSNISDAGFSLAVDGSNIYVTGVTNEIDNSGNSSDIITLKYTESDCDTDDRIVLQNKHKLQFIPRDFSLSQNYPNPFNPVTNIKFGIPKDAIVTLKVYDLLGKEIAIVIDNRSLEAGIYSYDFNASALSSGIYYYKLEAGEFSAVKKMAVIK